MSYIDEQLRAVIHYNVWFSFRSGIEEQEALLVIDGFLRELALADEIAGFQLLRNSGNPAKTQMLPFQALIEFRNDEQFAAAFSSQATRGIHAGLHGRVMGVIADFHVEVFRQITASDASIPPESSHQYACEV